MIALLTSGAAPALCGGASGCGGNAAEVRREPRREPVARVLPSVELVTLEGQPSRVQALTSGKVALLAFWAPWCEACTTEFEALRRLQAQAASRGAVVIAVAVGEPRAKVAEYVATWHLQYPQLIDEQFRLADALGQRSVPSTVIVDRAGRVAYSGGALDRNALAALRAALE